MPSILSGFYNDEGRVLAQQTSTGCVLLVSCPELLSTLSLPPPTAT